MTDTTHFGFQSVPTGDKQAKVDAVFGSVAQRYDLMNDLMSCGLHRLWKRLAISHCHLRPRQKVLDLACGTGDLSLLIAPQIAPGGQLYLSDINASMLGQGRRRLIDAGIVQNTHYIQANAECLPFPDNYFDCITMGFGLRNVTNKPKVLTEMARLLRPGGRVVILEFSKPYTLLEPLYDWYSFQVLPRLGAWVAGDRDSYQYLVESIRMHPDAPTLQHMMQEAGLIRCRFQRLSGGITAIHQGFAL